MADPISSFRRYFQTTTDPYVPLGAVYDSFNVIAPIMGPAALIGALESAAYPLPLLLSGDNQAPLVVVTAFTPTALPGRAAPEGKYAFCGDVSANMVLPGLVCITNQSFHQRQATTVLERGDIEAAWAALPAGDALLASPDAAANTHDVTTPRAMPIPHQYTKAVLLAYVQGTLTWRSLWADVAVAVLADVNQSQAYSAFLDFLQVASTRHPPVQTGDPKRQLETEMAYAGALMTPVIQERALQVARNFLPGLREAVGVGAQLHQVQQNQTNLQQAIVNAQATREAMLESEKPELYDTLLRYNVVTTELELAPYWSSFPKLKQCDWNSTMNTCTQCIVRHQNPPMVPPILLPALMTDIGTGNFNGQLADITKGLSIFSMRPGNSPNCKALKHQGRAYMIVALGTGSGQEDVVRMILENDEVELHET